MTLRTIDLSRGPESLAPELDEVCRDVGFLRVGGHGIAPDLVAEMTAVCAEYFALPGERKMWQSPPPLNRGYTPPFAEQLGTTLDDDRVERPVDVPDLFESFTIGDPEREPANAFLPDTPARFGLVWRAWWHEMRRVGDALLECCAVALGLSRHWFEPSFRRPLTVLRAIHYPATSAPALPGQMRAGPHTDYGSMTILHTDDVPGLEVHHGGRWEPVEPVPGLLVVNVGDLLARWTNDRWRSTLHRVVPVDDAHEGLRGRHSIAWFQQPDHDALIECLPTCTSASNPPRHPPITSGEHYDGKIARQFAGTREEASTADPTPIGGRGAPG